MSFYEDQTPESVKAEIWANYHGNLDTRVGSFLDLIVSPVAYEIYKLRMDREALMSIIFPDETSGTYIDMDGQRDNITRKPGTYAEADITFTGKSGTVIPAETAFLTAGGREYRLLEPVTLSEGSGHGTIRAMDVGAEYNAGAGEIDQIYVAIPGLDSFSAGAAEGGADPESNAELLARIREHRRHPASSGNRYDYYNWAMSVSGVGAASVKGLWAGPGTVKVLLAAPSGGKVDEDVVRAVKEYIEEQRPIGPEVTVVSVSEREIPVTARIRLNGKADIKAVTAEFSSAYAAYLAGVGLDGGVVSYNKVAYLLLNMTGVEDFTELSVDGGMEPVTIGPDVGAVAGEIDITEAQS